MSLVVAPICPKCGEIMEEVSKGKTGPFWGCPKYRETGCRGSAPMKLDPARAPTGVEPEALFVVDTETTGFGPLAEIVEIACWALDARTLQQLAPPVAALAKPLRPIPADATAVHGITDAMVEGCGTPRQAVLEVLRYARSHEKASSAWLAHNAPFDLGMINRAIGVSSNDSPSWPVYCSLGLAQKAFPKLSAHKLGHLASRLGIPAPAAHRALGDVQTTAQMLRKVMKVWDGFTWGALPLAGRI